MITIKHPLYDDVVSFVPMNWVQVSETRELALELWNSRGSHFSVDNAGEGYQFRNGNLRLTGINLTAQQMIDGGHFTMKCESYRRGSKVAGSYTSGAAGIIDIDIGHIPINDYLNLGLKFINPNTVQGYAKYRLWLSSYCDTHGLTTQTTYGKSLYGNAVYRGFDGQANWQGHLQGNIVVQSFILDSALQAAYSEVVTFEAL